MFEAHKVLYPSVKCTNKTVRQPDSILNAHLLRVIHIVDTLCFEHFFMIVCKFVSQVNKPLEFKICMLTYFNEDFSTSWLYDLKIRVILG